MAPTTLAKKKCGFDPKKFLATFAAGKILASPKETNNPQAGASA
ncbi:MAG: hypothetical protein WBQ74_04530 [Candidatus Sulfotelmatobacter sp.]|jgi:hypothetical protein